MLLEQTQSVIKFTPNTHFSAPHVPYRAEWILCSSKNSLLGHSIWALRGEEQQPEDSVLALPDLMLPSSRQIPFQRLYNDAVWMLSLTCFTSSCFCRIFSQFRTRNTWCFNTKFLHTLKKKIQESPSCSVVNTITWQKRQAFRGKVLMLVVRNPTPVSCSRLPSALSYKKYQHLHNPQLLRKKTTTEASPHLSLLDMGFIWSCGVSLVGVFTLSLGSSGMWPLWKTDHSDRQEELCQELHKPGKAVPWGRKCSVSLFVMMIRTDFLSSFTHERRCLYYLPSFSVCAWTSSSPSTSQSSCGCSQVGCSCLEVHSLAGFYPQLSLCISQTHTCKVALEKQTGEKKKKE